MEPSAKDGPLCVFYSSSLSFRLSLQNEQTLKPERRITFPPNVN